MVLRPFPANQPASVWALRPQGSTRTQVSAQRMASRSALKPFSAMGWVRLSMYSAGCQSCQFSSTSGPVEGAGRFVIGLAADVKILEGDALRGYILDYQKKYIQKL